MARRETPEEARQRIWNSAQPAQERPAQPQPPAAYGQGPDRPDTQAGRDTQQEEPHAPPGHWRAPAYGNAPAQEPSSADDNSSVGELVKQLSEQSSTLIRQEMRLAQVELQEKGKKAGLGAGIFGVGGLVAFYGVAALIVAAVLLLATALDAWLSAVIVGVVLLAVAGVAALMGKKQIEQAIPPAPEQAIGSVKRDVDTVKRKARK